ncbi:MAG: class I SAM-dependent methyltransferase [Planctomycetota bacterium]|nr:class I SAM-dependent methyltransferase [Planctomycetota bacterium]
MDPRQEKVSRFYDGVWTRYVQDREAAERHMAEVFPPELIRGRVALDCGCGGGAFSLALVRSGARFVVGLDISIGSIRMARRLNAAGRLEYIVGNMESLPFGDGRFEVIWAWGSVEHTADPWRAMAELDRVLAPGGRMLLALYRRTRLSPLHGAIRAAFSSLPRRLHAPLSRAGAAVLSPVIRLFRRREKMRSGEELAGVVHDWFFVPLRHHFDPAEVRRRFVERGYAEELFVPATGRFDSSSHFIIRVRKGARRGEISGTMPFRTCPETTCRAVGEH